MGLTECHLLVNGRESQEESQDENHSRKQDAAVSLPFQSTDLNAVSMIGRFT